MDLHKQCALLSKPFWWSTEIITAAAQPIEFKSDLIKRVFGVAAAVLLAPISLPLKGVSESLLFFSSASFTYLNGETSSSPAKRQLSLLNWNICGLPGGLPRLFGGVPPLRSRVEKVVTFILKEDCDIVCLQEAHDVSAAYEMIKRLRHRYSHFYLNIGSKAFQHNSGLFVASKNRLSQPSFTPFQYKGKQFGINKGYFSFEVAAGTQQTVRIIATHMQPYVSKQAQEIRAKELEEISEQQPDIICGDLNINRFDPEERSDIIQKKYYDALGKIETATDSLMGNDPQNAPLSIDYCLSNHRLKDLQTRLAEAYDVENTESSLSDHHALRSSLPLSG